MNEQEFEFEDGKLYSYTHQYYYGANGPKVILNKEILMTKELFQECYKRWIKEENKEVRYINQDTNEDTDDEIKVGDEVINTGSEIVDKKLGLGYGIVISKSSDQYIYVLTQQVLIQGWQIDYIKKTGKHLDHISELSEWMSE